MSNLPFDKSAPPEPPLEKEAPAQPPRPEKRQKRTISRAAIKKAAFWFVFAAVTGLWLSAFTLGIINGLTSPLGTPNANLLISLVCVLAASLIILVYLFVSCGFVKKFEQSNNVTLAFAAFILTLAMSFTAVISALGAVASSTRKFGMGTTLYEVDRCTFAVTAENEVCLADGSLFGDEILNIPEEVNGHKVTAISANAFYGKTALLAINIPDSVTEVHSTAFAGCKNVSTAEIPACAVAALPKDALHSVTVTNGEIESEAFARCTSLTYATLSDGVNAIGDSAFLHCKSLESLIVSDSVTIIGERAFYGCSKLKYTEYNGAKYLGNKHNPYAVITKITDKQASAFTILKDTKAVCPDTFSGCANLAQISVDNKNGNYRESGNCLIQVSHKILVAGFKNSVIPVDGSVTVIGANAFANRGVTFKTVPDCITEIGNRAFYGCKDFSEFTVPRNVKRLDDEAFSGCNNLVGLTLSDGLEEIGSYAFSYCNRLTEIILPDSLKTLGASAFNFCSKLTEINVPANVTEIGSALFSGCYNLATVTVDGANRIYHSNGNCIIKTAEKTLTAGCSSSTIPTDGSVTKIGEGAFYCCYSITRITIPDGITEICAQAYDTCLNLTEVTLPSSVKKIGNRAFANCQKITGFYFKGTAAEWEKVDKYQGDLNNGWNVGSDFTIQFN